jgi:hypothetical protein
VESQFGFLGKPRFTADVDAMFLLSIQDIPQFLKLASKEDIVPRIKDAEAFADPCSAFETCAQRNGN